MINPFVMKKYATLILAPMLATIAFYVGTTFFGVFYGLGFMFAGMLLSVFIGVVLLKNPFTLMLEGKGILVLNLDSTGVIRPFLVGIDSPFIKGKIGKKDVEDVFNRKSVFELAQPVKAAKKAQYKEKGGLILDLSEEMYNKGRFALFHYPVLIYNEQLSTIITKDFLSDAEKNLYIEHVSLYLSQKVRELTTSVTNFGRYIVENLKPAGKIKPVWLMVALLIIVIIFGLMFGPAIIKQISSVAGDAGGIMGSIGTDTITPKG